MMKRILTWLIFVIALIVLNNFSVLLADERNCPETLIADFKQSVRDRETAIRLFTRAFSIERGFPHFDEKMLRGPYLDDLAVPRGSYSYYGWYGHGEKKVGGLLYPDGRLVQRGYCK